MGRPAASPLIVMISETWLKMADNFTPTFIIGSSLAGAKRLSIYQSLERSSQNLDDFVVLVYECLLTIN